MYTTIFEFTFTTEITWIKCLNFTIFSCNTFKSAFAAIVASLLCKSQLSMIIGHFSCKYIISRSSKTSFLNAWRVDIIIYFFYKRANIGCLVLNNMKTSSSSLANNTWYFTFNHSGFCIIICLFNKSSCIKFFIFKS